MIKPVICLAAESTSVDGGTNRLSIFHVLEQVHSPAFPLLIPRVSFVTMFERDPGDPASVTYEVVFDDNGKIVHRAPFPVDFQTQMRARTLAEVGALPITGPGVFKMAILDGTNELCAWRIEVRQLAMGVQLQPIPGSGTAAPPTPPSISPVPQQRQSKPKAPGKRRRGKAP
jgi:hypothetical protein